MDAAESSINGPSLVRQRLARLLTWARRAGVGAKVEIALAVVAVASAIATYFALSTRNAPFNVATDTIRTMLLVNLVLLSALAALIARRLVRLWIARRQGSAGSKLHTRMVGLFSLVAIGPPIIMAVTSALFFEFGIESWFSRTVRDTLNSSLEVAEAYIDEHRETIKLDLLAMANDLNRNSVSLQQDPELLELFVSQQLGLRALSEAIVFNEQGVILAKSSLNLGLAANRMPTSAIQRAQDGELVVLASADDDRVHAIMKLADFYDAYLYVSRYIDPRVLSYVEAAQNAVSNYERLEGERTQIQIRFNVIFIIVALLILFAAVWIGLWFANRLATPISSLVDTAERVREGDLSARTPETNATDEIGRLSRSFNRMTRQLENQRTQLIQANAELDERRRFLEAVLGGVTAGVIGLTADGRIHLPNRSACTLLGLSYEELMGKHLSEIEDQFFRLMREADQSSERIAQSQIGLSINGRQRTFLARMVREISDEQTSGYVLTFDDITEQLADQRTAAWADVARRIAHEIKNPLTPIQLSAERLRRKYMDEIASDPEVFSQCTDTIIRQVGDLRHMVDEFSSFARMPAPRYHQEDLVEVVRQAVFLQEVGSEDINFVTQLPDEPVSLSCDARLLGQGIANVLKNATESVLARRQAESEAGEKPVPGEITVKLKCTQKATEIIVEDNGAGLPPDKERLTEPYVTTRTKGTGLGLAIVKRIMEEHGGELQLINRRTGGARAILHIDHHRLSNKHKKSARHDEGELEHQREEEVTADGS